MRQIKKSKSGTIFFKKILGRQEQILGIKMKKINYF